MELADCLRSRAEAIRQLCDFALEQHRQEASLAEALYPFASFAGVDLSGTAYESGGENTPILFHHKSGVQVTLGDLWKARSVYAALTARTS